MSSPRSVLSSAGPLRVAIGLLATLCILIVSDLVTKSAPDLPNPSVLQLLAVIFAALIGGVASGLLSAGLIVGYALVSQSTDHEAGQVLTIAAAALAAALMVGLLRRRLGRILDAEAAAARTVRDFEQLVHGLDAVIWEADAATFQFTFASDAAERLLGYPTRQWIEETDFWENHIHPDDRERAVSSCRIALEEGRDHSFEYRALTSDGRVVWIRDIVRTVRDAGGRTVGLRGVMIDITSQRRAEEALRREEGYVQLLQQVAVAANEANSSDQALLECIHLVCRHTGWPVGHAYRADESGSGVLWPTEIWHLDDSARFARFREITQKSTFAPGVGLPGRVRATGRAAWIADVYKDGNFTRTAHARELGVHGAFGFPVLSGRDVAAVLEFFTAAPQEPDERLLETMEHVGAQIGRVIERERAARVLRESEKRFEMVTRATNDAVWDWDVATGKLWWNEGITTMFDYPPEQVRPELAWWSERLHPDDRERIIQDVQAALEGGGRSWSGEYRFLGAEGAYANVFDRGLILRDASGRATRMIGAMLDITARKKTEEALRDSEERYKLLFDRNPQSMWVIDQDSLAFLAVNDAALRQYGTSREEFLSMTLRDLRPRGEEPGLMEAFGSTTLRYGPAKWTHRRRDGTEVQAEVSASRLDFWGRPAWLLHASDVTEKARLEAQLLNAQKMEAVGRLAGGVAHDFNNLLTVISGYADVLLQELRTGSPAREDLQQIARAAERASELTRQLLAVGRRQVLAPRVLDLNDVVQGLTPMLGRAVGEHIRLTTALEPSSVSVEADAGQIEQVLMNLALNARDAMPQGGELRIQTALFEMRSRSIDGQYVDLPEGRYVLLEVRDSGLGMDDEVRAHAFEPFYTTKGADKGTGLGLPTVYGIVKQTGGEVIASSHPGEGTAIRVILPCAVREVPDVPTPAPAAPSRTGNETVLLVEDEPMVRSLAQRALSMHGYEVVEASDAAEALSLADSLGARIDLLVTDVVMPHMNGRELFERMSETRPGLRVLYISGYSADVIADHGALAPATHLLQKPFTPGALGSKVREVLDSRPGCP